MNDDQIRELCQKLKPVIGQRADALWLSYVSSETPKAKLETEALIQMFALRELSRQVDEENILLPPPNRDDAKGEFLLGTIQYGTKPIHKLFHVYSVQSHHPNLVLFYIFRQFIYGFCNACFND